MAVQDAGTKPGRISAIYGVYVLLMIGSLPIFLFFATERFTLLARLLAWIGLSLSLLPSVVLLARPRSPMNSIAAVGLIIAVFYHLAVFHETRLPLRWGDARISDTSVELALLLAALATPALWGGWYLLGRLGIGRVLPHPRLEIQRDTLRTAGLWIALSSLVIEALWLRGELTTAPSVVGIIALLTPLELGFSLLLIRQLCGPATLWDRALVAAMLMATGVLSLTCGMILPVIKPLLIYLLGWLFIRRRAPVLAVAVMVATVVLMQPVKAEFRQQVWDRQVEMGLFDRAQLYVDLLSRHWMGGEFDAGVDRGDSVQLAAARTGAALPLANYIELTPSSVPHQWGKTYRYLLHAPVPRILDPDKPIAQYADVWAAVMYGYASQQMTAHVMVGLSQIAECYINFGFIGALLALTLIGMLYRCVDEILAHPRAGPGALALYLYYLQSIMLGSEGSFAQFWGGAVQGLVFYALCLAVLGRGFSRPHVRLWATASDRA